jgi:hypothetical protein
MKTRLATILILLGSTLSLGALTAPSQEGIDDQMRSAITQEDSGQSTINISPSANQTFSISYNWDGGMQPFGGQQTGQLTIKAQRDGVRIGGKTLTRGTSYALFVQDLHSSSPKAILFQKNGKKVGALQVSRIAPQKALYDGFSANVYSKNNRDGSLVILNTKAGKQGGLRIPVAW